MNFRLHNSVTIKIFTLQFEKSENMNVEQTWKNGYTGRDVVVAIVDDGVWFNNSDILPNYVSTTLFQFFKILLGFYRTGI